MKVILAEKPSVAKTIAQVLNINNKHDGYYEGNNLIVTWAYGHLVELAEPDDYDPSLKKWSVDSLPFIPETFKLAVTKDVVARKQFNIIKQLFKDADELICATDAGREGELIFRHIQVLTGSTKKPFRRFWTSSLTDISIKKAFQELKNGQEYNRLYNAAKSRQEADWIVGINLTRLYSLKYGGKGNVISVGRVQTPVLSMIVERHNEIVNFKSVPYWELCLNFKEVIFKHEKGKFENKDDAQNILNKILNKIFTIIEVTSKDMKELPPLLFDLTSLQMDINRRFSYSAEKTLNIAQKLYEEKLITYPRTDSCYLTNDMIPTITGTLSKLRSIKPDEISSLDINNLKITKRIIDDKKVSDHHAIIPTGELSHSLSTDEKNVYDAIVVRFISVFYPECIKKRYTVKGEIEKEIFTANATKIVELGWRGLYKYKDDEETEEPIMKTDLKVKESGIPKSIYIEDKMTQPPKEYTEATLLSAMETAGKRISNDELKDAMKERGLGTPATRANIIETLIRRSFIVRQKKNILPTDKGTSVISEIKDSLLKSPEMTGEWEMKLKKMEKGEYDRELFMKQIKEYTLKSSNELKNAEVKKIQNTYNTIEEIKDRIPIGTCPICNKKMYDKGGIYGCEGLDKDCTFKIFKKYAEKIIPITQVKKLLKNGKTDLIKGFKAKTGKKFPAVLKIEDGKVTFSFEERSVNSIGKCPLCGGDVIALQQLYGCSNFKESNCQFKIWKSIAGKTISETMAKKLIKKGSTDIISGFKSKMGKPFDAKLVLVDGKVEMDFSK